MHDTSNCVKNVSSHGSNFSKQLYIDFTSFITIGVSVEIYLFILYCIMTN